ncbi:MAG: DnaJ domain-containing protein [Betaproteobacteria bacterium]|nr:DnaJ domain-containing protein [Betaproteobacteria bacterium]
MPGSPSADRTARLLLRYARDPSRYRTEARGPDASLVDTDVVLRLAQGRRVELGGPTIEGTDTVALRDAAVGYLREVFFRPDASPYQTLGLAPDASQDAIKERFRLLMLLVHPDRQGAGPAWPDRCASQANQAYAILRDPGSRAAFDRQEREKAAAAQAAQQAAVAKAAALKSRPSRGPAGSGARRPPEPPVLPEWLTAGVGGFVREHPAGTAFGALIGAAVLVVGAALWDREGGTLVRASRSPEPPAPRAVADRRRGSAGRPESAGRRQRAGHGRRRRQHRGATAPAPAPAATSPPHRPRRRLRVAPRAAPSAVAVAVTVAPLRRSFVPTRRCRLRRRRPRNCRPRPRARIRRSPSPRPRFRRSSRLPRRCQRPCRRARRRRPPRLPRAVPRTRLSPPSRRRRRSRPPTRRSRRSSRRSSMPTIADASTRTPRCSTTTRARTSARDARRSVATTRSCCASRPGAGCRSRASTGGAPARPRAPRARSR